MGGGLAQMDAPKGSLIAYATAPGKTAADGESRNGLYTQELLKHIQTPGLPLESVFSRDFPLARIERVAWREFSGQVE